MPVEGWASLMHRNCDTWGLLMKSSTFPSVRVEPKLRQAAEKVLREGESLSSFVEQSIRQQVRQRELQHQFIERGLQSDRDAKASGEYHTTDEVLAELDQILVTAQGKRR